ncbi:hypothetical protein WJX72_001028 [[Myrmecia] bisecta]|uniref:Uncharacterized protein n=1 Tax=[Myrmecia] bisecta TaxID=41462 RepID=A0AAW1QPN4_9CHLO
MRAKSDALKELIRAAVERGLALGQLTGDPAQISAAVQTTLRSMSTTIRPPARPLTSTHFTFEAASRMGKVLGDVVLTCPDHDDQCYVAGEELSVVLDDASKTFGPGGFSFQKDGKTFRATPRADVPGGTYEWKPAAPAAVTTSVPNEIHEFKEEIKNEFKSDLQEFSQKIDKKLSEMAARRVKMLGSMEAGTSQPLEELANKAASDDFLQKAKQREDRSLTWVSITVTLLLVIMINAIWPVIQACKGHGVPWEAVVTGILTSLVTAILNPQGIKYFKQLFKKEQAPELHRAPAVDLREKKKPKQKKKK